MAQAQFHSRPTQVRSLLADRTYVAATPGSAPRAAWVVRKHGSSGVIVVGSGLPKAMSTIRAQHDKHVVMGADPGAYGSYVARSDRPMDLPTIMGDRDMPLEEYVANLALGGADLVFTPTGRLTDLGTVSAAVTEANRVRRNDVVLCLPLSQRLLPPARRLEPLQAAMQKSRHPIAVTVIGEFDPFEDTDVARALRQLSTVPCGVVLHRTDFAAFEVLAHGGLGGSIGYTAGLRHTVVGRRPARTRTIPSDKSPIVLLPEIDSFRHVNVFERWFRKIQPPICDLADCCGRDLTGLASDQHDHDVANEHNLRAWLPLARALAELPRHERDRWLHEYRVRISKAYDHLRKRTQIREIKMDSSQTTWLSLGP